MDEKNIQADILQARDKIAQVYLGLWGGGETQERARRRINWLASQVEGKYILDIGCSEGILALLLAREGINVFGVDINKQALDYAKELLDKEIEPVSKRVTLLHGDLISMELNERSFDTVVLGEVLEHLVQPDLMLKRVCSLLKLGGKLLVTTPFGYFPDPDHKQTFTLSGFVAMLKPFVFPEHLTVEDGYIRFVGRKKIKTDIDWLNYQDFFLLKTTEQAALSQQKFLRSHIEQLKTTLNKLRQEYDANNKKIDHLKKDAIKLKEKLNNFEMEREILHELKEQTKLLEAERNNLAFKLNLLEKDNKLLRNQVNKDRASLQKIEQNYQLTKQNLQKVKDSISFQLGQAYVKAIAQPGKNTLMLPINVFRLFSLGLFRRKNNVSQTLLLKTITAKNDQFGRIEALFLDPSLGKNDFVKLSKSDKIKACITLNPPGRIALYASIDESKAETINNKSGIALFRFYDKSGNFLDLDDVIGLTWSTYINTWYVYFSGKEGSIVKDYNIANFRIPSKAYSCEITFRAWKYEHIRISNTINVEYLNAWFIEQFIIPKPCVETPGPRVACICDTFTYQSLCYDLNLFPLSRVSWQEELEKQTFDLLFVESAWQGNDGQWCYCLSNPSGPGFNELKKLVGAFKDRKIPTLFYNKEDPPNYKVFIETAKLFDIVVTTDRNCVERYRNDCGHNRIFVMPFAAQPKIHNPIGKVESDEFEIAFAGTWYKRKHAERAKLMPILLDPASQYNLTIFNRQSGWNKDDSYEFPDRFKPFLHNKVEYEEMLHIHKMFKVFLNFNSVIDSPTMFSRRVFEVLASSTLVISTESKGIREMFPVIVPIATSKNEAKALLSQLLSDDWMRRKIGHVGYREVMQHHTVRKRLSCLFEEIGIRYPAQGTAKVSLVIPTNRPANLKYIRENILRQNYPNLEAIIVLNSDEFDLQQANSFFSDISWVKVIQLPEEQTLGACLNAAIDESTGEYWAKLDDDNIYFDNFVSDMMLPLTYTDAKIVGKKTYFTYLEGSKRLILRFPGWQHRWVNLASGSAIVIDKTVFNLVRFPDVSVGEDTAFMRSCMEKGYFIYSPDCFNYVVVRREDTSSHTWKVKEKELTKGSLLISEGLDLSYVKV